MPETVIATKKKAAMLQDTQIVLPFARLRGKTLQADFDAGTVSSEAIEADDDCRVSTLFSQMFDSYDKISTVQDKNQKSGYS
jgi:hypothetical protein